MSDLSSVLEFMERNAMKAILLLCLVLLSTLPSTCGSLGDRSGVFQDCLFTCKRGCTRDGYPASLPFHLLLFGWTCEDECKYICMHNVTQYFLDNGIGVQKFYGKWPFIRLFGIQEPASVLFSIGNGLAHLCGWIKYMKHVQSSYVMYNTWKLYAMISMNAWFWSTVFHTRDLIWTERLDYLGATTLILANIYVVFVRTVGAENKLRCRLFLLLISILLVYHCWYLWFVHFDYGYNMQVSITLGVINISAWLTWCIKNWKERPYVWKCALTSTMLFFLVALELLDFPAIYGVLDAHALWHFSTMPFCYFWYSFLVDDARQDIKGHKTI